MKKLLRDIFDPFELLYLSVAVATFAHTAWAGSYLFEGEGSGLTWWLRGALIAIAVDVGMLMTSRFLQRAQTWPQRLVLVISFLVAAVTSWYTQTVYIAAHTPEYPMSVGVSQYWQDMLQPFIDARVILLPLALPVLASVYTLARIFRHYEREVWTADDHSGLRQAIKVTREAPKQLPAGDEIIETEGILVNLEDLTWTDTTTGKHYGPYSSRSTMRGAMSTVLKRRLSNQSDS